MASTPPICEKCGSRMREGRCLYRVNANYYPVLWVDGTPERRSFLGISGQNLNVSEKESFETTSYRCTGCGSIEMFAAQGKDED